MKDVGNISHEDFKDIAETKEIDPKELLHYLKQGWRVLMTFTREKAINKNEWNTEMNLTAYNTVVWSEPIILVGRTDLERLREVETAHKDLQKFNDELVKKEATVRQNFEIIKKDGERTSETLALVRADKDSIQKVLNEQRLLNKRMETDIAKIRSALGDIRMKEILS